MHNSFFEPIAAFGDSKHQVAAFQPSKDFDADFQLLGAFEKNLERLIEERNQLDADRFVSISYLLFRWKKCSWHHQLRTELIKFEFFLNHRYFRTLIRSTRCKMLMWKMNSLSWRSDRNLQLTEDGLRNNASPHFDSLPLFHLTNLFPLHLFILCRVKNL